MSVVVSISNSGSFDPIVGQETLAEVVSRLGDVPLHRIRSKPAPGTATEKDLILLAEKHGILCELIDGILVEKPVGLYESKIAFLIGHEIQIYLDKNPIAGIAGADGPLKTTPGHVRLPDISVVLNEKLTLEMLKKQKVLQIPPDLAVEVLSEANTKKEMDLKLKEYFEAGTRLVWYIDPESESAQAFRSPENFDTVSGDQPLTGGDLLPGLSVKLSDEFAKAKTGLPAN